VAASSFNGFPTETLKFLRQLKRNNNRDWFQKNKARYEAAFIEPSLAFIAAMDAPLKKISPSFTAIPKKTGGSLMRIYRDSRFSKDKTPYKTNIGIHFRHETGCSVHAPGFYLHIEPGSVFLGVGIWHPESKPLLKIRQTISEKSDDWKKVRDNRAFRRHYELSGDSLKRPPQGFSADDSMIDDLKRKDFIGVCELDEAAIHEKSFVKDATAIFRSASPLARFLCEAVDVAF
jgi:uncharacterized protein (TIGR02453 family)